MKNRRYLFYLNALFDLQLGGFPFRNLKQSSAEMSVLFGLMGSAEDRVLLDIEIPPEYLEYIHSAGLSFAEPFHNGDCSSFQAVSWGWNENSLKRITQTGAEVKCPDLSIIRRCNSRAFCHEINCKYGSGVPGSRYCQSIDDFSSALNSLKDSFPLVIKPAFGGSGYGFRRLASHVSVNSISDQLMPLIEHGGAVVEPWCSRLYDLSTSVYIESDGSISSYRYQRFLANRHGAFYAILLSPEDPVLDKYSPVMEKHVKPAVEELISAGYFGPAGFDSFVYTDSNGIEKVAPVIEINARFSMSDIAHKVWNQCAPDRYCLFRMISRNRCSLPESYAEFNRLITDFTFRQKSKTGCILLTPLRTRYGNNSFNQPFRNAFFIAAKSLDDLFTLDSCLRNSLFRY